MRNAVVGGILGLALIGALLAAAHFSRPHQQVSVQTNAPPPGEIARRIKSGFFGVQRIGAWDLVCRKPGSIPAWARGMRPVGSANAPTPPSFRCHVVTRLNGNSGRWADVNFQLVGPTRILFVSLKFASGLAALGQNLDLRLNETNLPLRVILCAPKDCVAVPTVDREGPAKMNTTGAEELVAAKRAVLMLPESLEGKPVPVNVPLYGLQPAVSALRRADLR
jgi:hypothetical protein